MTAVCPKCGRALAPDAPRGLCRKCLVSAMLESGPLETSPEQAARKALPREFGGYELLSEIARGGMGIVYRARQIQLNRTVALKVMASGQFAAPDFVKRFRTEAEAVARLDHPNIVPIHEVGESEGQPFFSMKLIEEGSLAQRIANRAAPLSNRDAAQLILKLAGAVHYAHQRGILHRDLKPANVLLDAQGEPFLTDFGLARLVEKDSTLTRTMAMLGTPSYMSPEQARGEAKQLTTAVDVYGLGALFYELLAGQPPFAGGTTMETVRQVLDLEPRRPSSLRADTDRDLETICLKCLEKEPTRRYGSAEALANDLERWLNHEPILARPATGAERLAKFVRRHPLGAAFSLTLFVVIAGSVAMLASANVHIRKAQANESLLRGQAERKAEESRQQLVQSNVNRGNRLAKGGDYFQALLWFTEALRLENGDAAREDVHRRRIATLLRQSPELMQLWFHDGFVNTAQFSANGEQVLTSSLDGTARIWRLGMDEPAAPTMRRKAGIVFSRFTPDEKRLFTIDLAQKLQFWDAETGAALGTPQPAKTPAFPDIGSSARWVPVPTAEGVQLYDAASDAVGPLLESTNGASMARFSPDGSCLVAAQEQRLQFWKSSAGKWTSSAVNLQRRIRGVSFSHDGKFLAAFAIRHLFLYDVASGTPVRPPVEVESDLFECIFSPNDRWLATASWDGAVRVYDAPTGGLVIDSFRHAGGISVCKFTPDGQRLATASWDCTARVWNPKTGEAESPSLPHSGYVRSLDFSPDGARLVTGGQEGNVRLWALRTNSGARLIVRHEQSIINSVQYSPDGAKLLTAGEDSRAQVWDVRTGRLLNSPRRSSEGVTIASFSPDGKIIVTASYDDTARLWDAETGVELVPAMRHTSTLNHAGFSRDGRRLVTASKDGTARVWDVANGEPMTPLLIHRGPVIHAAFSPDDRYVLTASKDQTAQLWDARTGDRVGPPMKHAGQVIQVNFSPDGRRLVTACTDNSELPFSGQIWDVSTSSAVGSPLQHLDGVLCSQFSPDGRYVATGSEDRMAAIWDAVTGARLSPDLPHTSYATCVVFSPDSGLLLTATAQGGDNTARIWESSTGEPVTPPLKHNSGMYCAAWSPDGREVALGATDGTITLWDVSATSDSLESLQRRAEILAARRIGPNRGLVPLSAKEMRERWHAIRKQPTP